jgi:hypothetical protein
VVLVRRWFGRHGNALDDIEIEQVSLSRGFHQPFPPWAKDVAAVELELAAQLLDELLMLLDGLIVELAGFIERGLKILDLLTMELRGLIERRLEVFDLPSEPAQQVVTLLRISRP